ncbi:hypothetical protein M9H77_20517 [Catharanthus roseus]|uniref:Uncharacterized protein n=1 Tax=Catharanthus roseus TaxID=4058 RepID=A0ACC0AK52_CATRO|nr:hypothetical protein M9H77_20517 [Catharanthus roseus]
MRKNTRNFVLPNCYCGKVSVGRTSWTNKNPARRFASCGHSQVQFFIFFPHSCQRCDCFEWLEPELSERSSGMIPVMVEKIKIIESDLELVLAENKRLEEKIGEIEEEESRN